MSQDWGLDAIFADLEAMGIGELVMATVYARKVTKAPIGTSQVSRGDARGDALQCYLDPLGEVKELRLDREVRAVTHRAYCPTEMQAVVRDFFVTDAGEEYEVLRALKFSGHHLEIDLEEVRRGAGT